MKSMSESRRAPSLQAATIDAVKLEYYRYEVTYGLYMMTPIEKIVANVVIVVLLPGDFDPASRVCWHAEAYCIRRDEALEVLRSLTTLRWLLERQTHLLNAFGQAIVISVWGHGRALHSTNDTGSGYSPKGKRGACYS